MLQRLFGQNTSNDTNDVRLTFFYRLVSYFKLFKSIILLWSHPILTQIRVDFLQIIEKFFNDMLYSTESLNYLLVSSKQTTTALIKLMLKKQQQLTPSDDGNIISNSITNQLVYSLQTLIYINNLNVNELYDSMVEQEQNF